MWRRGGERPPPGTAKIRHASIACPFRTSRKDPGHGRRSVGVTRLWGLRAVRRVSKVPTLARRGQRYPLGASNPRQRRPSRWTRVPGASAVDAYRANRRAFVDRVCSETCTTISPIAPPGGADGATVGKARAERTAHEGKPAFRGWESARTARQDRGMRARFVAIYDDRRHPNVIDHCGKRGRRRIARDPAVARGWPAAHRPRRALPNLP
jgi:hypothetical protein